MEDFTGSFKANPTPPKPAKRMIPLEHLEDFKKEVEGSDLTKIALVEALKKKYVLPPTIAARLSSSPWHPSMLNIC